MKTRMLTIAVVFIGMLTHAIEREFWSHKENRKEFFDRFARKRGFDPRVPENWYSVELESISKERVFILLCLIMIIIIIIIKILNIT